MAQNANPINLQQIEVNVNGPDDINRMYITTGSANVYLQAYDNTASGSGITQKETFSIKLDPQLASNQFRRSIATASLAQISCNDNDPATVDGMRWTIEEVDADFDDETGKIDLRIALAVFARGNNSITRINGLNYQVTTLAAISE